MSLQTVSQALQQLQQQGEQQSRQQQAQSESSSTGGQESGQQLQALELTPEDILDQERVARQRRQLLQGQQQSPVEKDW
jgi:methylphosphotriester-DNA--protein-cysteine methyltransferase